MEAKRYHFIGIGGVGMSAIAEIFKKTGAIVTGSDRLESEILQRLRTLGIDCWVGSAPEKIPGPCTVVYSSAIRVEDPEFKFASEQGWTLIHRSQALALAAADKAMVAVTGAHGKTTITSMMAVALDKIGSNPSFAIGANVPYFGAGARWTEGKIFVAEADESDGSFIHYHPKVAIISNVDADHLDNYGNQEVFEAAFYRFATTVKEAGALVLNTDDPGCYRLLQRIEAARNGALEWPKFRFIKKEKGGQQSFVEKILETTPPDLAKGITIIGVGEKEKPVGVDIYWQIVPERDRSSGATPASNVAKVSSSRGQEYDLRLKVPGIHNLHNAVSVMAAVDFLGEDTAAFTTALSEFTGAKRRFELIGTVGNIRVYDDFAHHPTELEALIQQAKEIAGDGKVRLLFQPHLASRTILFAKQFAEVLQKVDQCVLCDIYLAREDHDPSITSELITKHAPMLEFVPNRDDAAKYIADCAKENDILITSGGGNLNEITADIVDHLEQRKG